MTSVDVLKRSLSFAVRLRDDFTGERTLVGSPRLFLVGQRHSALQNPSGYFVFCDLVGHSFALRVEADYYFDAEIAVDTTALDRRAPVVPVTLRPNPSYPFSESVTLLRGQVTGTAGAPLSGATITLIGSPFRASSWRDGRFALYLPALQADDVTIVDGRNCLTIGGLTELSISVEHPAFAAKQVAVGRVAEARTTLLPSPIALSP